jgi:hypothetical protein
MTLSKTEQEHVRKYFPFYILLIILGFIVVRWGMPAFNAFIQKQRPDVAILIYLGILAILGLSGLPMGIYGFRLARRISSTGQVPPRMKEFKWGSNLEEGALAQRTSRMVYFMSIVLVLCSFGIVALCIMLYRSFIKH